MKRVKRRYLALQIESDGIISQKELMDAVWGAVTKLYGECGASLTSLSLIDYDVEKRYAVIRVSLASLNMVRASLASIISVANRDAAVRVLAVSGTIKALFEKLKA